VSPRRGKNNGAGERGDRQAFRSRKRICRPPEAVGRRTNVRMARAVQASRQRLGESQSKGARISAPRFNQNHAEKTMQSRMISPDRLSETSLIRQPPSGVQSERNDAPATGSRDGETSCLKTLSPRSRPSAI